MVFTMRITVVIAILTLSFALLGGCNTTFAQAKDASASADQLIKTVAIPGAVDLGESLVHPGSPLYFLKTLREKIEVALDGTPETKSMRQVEFAQRRLREVNSLVKARKQDLIPQTLEAYKVHLQKAEQFSKIDEELTVKVGEAIARHLDVLQRVYDNVGNPTAKAAIRAAIERSEEQNSRLIEKLSTVPQQKLIRKIAGRQAYACNFLMREATSSGLNDSERESLKKRVETCRADIMKSLKDELEELKKTPSTPSATSR